MHSTDATFANGTFITNNIIRDNPIDGIDIHGQYYTIDGNSIIDNIDSNHANNHPDGIQFINSTVDGMTSAQFVIIKNNLIRNHTQNVFLEGPVEDVDIFNNVIYNDTSGLVNGADFGTLFSKNISTGSVQRLRIYGNIIGHASNVSIRFFGNGPKKFPTLLR